MTLIVHPQCGSTWTGSRREHCPACCTTFNSNSAAEAHRRGTFSVDRRCITPTEAGLVAVEHDWGTAWQNPGTSDPKAR